MEKSKDFMPCDPPVWFDELTMARTTVNLQARINKALMYKVPRFSFLLVQEKLKDALLLRNRFRFAVLGLYLLPLLLHHLYWLGRLPLGIGWTMWVSGIFLVGLGGLALWYLVHCWEVALRARVSQLIREKCEAFFPKLEAQIASTASAASAGEMSAAALKEAAFFQENCQALEEKVKGQEHLMAQLNHKLQEAEERFECAQKEGLEAGKKMHELQESWQRLEETAHLREKELEDAQEAMQQELSHKDALLTEYQKTIGEQRSHLEKKHQVICQLENKVRDLTYEVKTLLQLSSVPVQSGKVVEDFAAASQHPLMEVFDHGDIFDEETDSFYQGLTASSNKEIQTPYDAAIQLQKCVEKVQKLRGIDHLRGDSSRFTDLTPDHYAIDLRRLFDSFRNENAYTVLIYSLSERKLIFVNQHIYSVLGWHPKKFVKDFDHLVQKGMKDWEAAVEKLQDEQESHARLLLRSKTGEDIFVHCHLGAIPSGVFKNYVVGILFPI